MTRGDPCELRRCPKAAQEFSNNSAGSRDPACATIAQLLPWRCGKRILVRCPPLLHAKPMLRPNVAVLGPALGSSRPITSDAGNASTCQDQQRACMSHARDTMADCNAEVSRNTVANIAANPSSLIADSPNIDISPPSLRPLPVLSGYHITTCRSGIQIGLRNGKLIRHQTRVL